MRPDFKRLRTLYNYIMSTVPPERFNLNFLWESYDGQPGCGCALGWAFHIPEFAKAGLRYSYWELSDFGATQPWVTHASAFFSMSPGDVNFVFGSASHFEPRQHKQAWGMRVQYFFSKYNEPLNGRVPEVVVQQPKRYDYATNNGGSISTHSRDMATDMARFTFLIDSGALTMDEVQALRATQSQPTPQRVLERELALVDD